MRMSSKNPSPFDGSLDNGTKPSIANIGGIMDIADQVRRSFETVPNKNTVSAATAAAAQQLAYMNKRKMDYNFQHSTSSVWRKTRPFHSPIASLTRQESTIKEIIVTKPKKRKASKLKHSSQTALGIILNSPPNEIFVTYNDVVCGRGKMTTNLVGNRRFRVWIEINLRAFAKASTEQERWDIAASIVDTIHDSVPNGRFLSLDIHSGVWHDIGRDNAINVTLEVLHEDTKFAHECPVSPKTDSLKELPSPTSPRTLMSKAA
ncbi:hypothetical protein ACHAXS_000995 [Conticribra weissflogii]